MSEAVSGGLMFGQRYSPRILLRSNAGYLLGPTALDVGMLALARGVLNGDDDNFLGCLVGAVIDQIGIAPRAATTRLARQSRSGSPLPLTSCIPVSS